VGEYAMIDSTIVRAHQHSAGARKKGRATSYRSQQGRIEHKIHTTVDALGNPTGFHLSEGQACELDGADALPPQVKAKTVIADKGFDADKLMLEPLKLAGKQTVIPPKVNHKEQRFYDKELYQARHLIENFFAKLKLFRAIATRYDKTAHNFLAAIHLAATTIWLI
jgi:transposase